MCLRVRDVGQYQVSCLALGGPEFLPQYSKREVFRRKFSKTSAKLAFLAVVWNLSPPKVSWESETRESLEARV